MKLSIFDPIWLSPPFPFTEHHTGWLRGTMIDVKPQETVLGTLNGAAPRGLPLLTAELAVSLATATYF